MIAAGLLAAAGPGAAVRAAEPAAQDAGRHTVAGTHHGHAFEYRIEPLAAHSAYDVYRVRFPSPVPSPVPENNTVPAELYVPRSCSAAARAPAVVCLHILHGNFELERLTCSTLAGRGVVAALMMLPYYGDRSPGGGSRALAEDPQRFLAALPQGLADVRRLIDLLASRAEVDPQRLGVIGISLGGIVAATAAAQDPRVGRAALILAGGDLLEIIHHARETRGLSRMIQGLSESQRRSLESVLRDVDPLSNAPRLRQRAADGGVLMINARQDEVIPPANSRKLAEALGIGQRVQWLEGVGHYSAILALPRVLDEAAEFLGGSPSAAGAARGPEIATPATAAAPAERLSRLVQQAAALVVRPPRPGQGHVADLEVSVTSGGKTTGGTVRFCRGAENRFRLEVSAAGLFQGAMGQGTTPWMVAGGTKALRGTGDHPSRERDPLVFAEPGLRGKLLLLGTAIQGFAASPPILEQLLTIRTGADGTALEVATKDGRRGTARIDWQEDRRTPRDVAFNVRGTEGRIVVRQWQTDVPLPETQFEPPTGVPVQEVPAEDILRMWGAMFNFAMEQAP